MSAPRSTDTGKLSLLAVYTLFTLSGFVALIYEGIWARYLKLFLGHSSYGQILTLAIFMGGMGLGALLASRYTRSLKNPFLAYAAVELLIGLGGLAYHDLYQFSTQLFYDNATGLADAMIEPLKLVIAILITAPMAILLGSTFPLLGVALVRSSRDGGQAAFPMLYFTNSIGAAVGILLASYLLIPQLGTHGALLIAALGNLLIAAGFFVIGRQHADQQRPRADEFTEVERPALAEGTLPVNLPHGWNDSNSLRYATSLFLGLSLLTGFASFVYEIGWIRLLSLLLGASTHSFDIMVSAFVLGLACGGLFAKKLLQKTRHVVHLLALAQLLMGGFALFSIYFYEPAFTTMQHAREFLDKTETGYLQFSLLKYGLSLFLMFPTTFVAGMTLPIITFFLMNLTRNEKQVGAVYGYNTIGAILGAVAGGLILLPVLQLKMTIATGAIIDIGIGLLLLALFRTSRVKLGAALASAVLVLLPLFVVSFDPNLIAAGYYRRTAFVMPDEKVTVRDGRTATISLHEVGDIKLIKTNGKTDAAIGGTKGEDTQNALAFLPMSMIDRPYSAAVIGMGSGMTAHYLLGDPLLQELDLIEIEEEVYNLARMMMPNNHRVYEDPRANLIVDDARTFFSTSRKRYDVIISEPSNPWVSGVSSLFSQEFYQHSVHFLKDDGILVQWMHLPEFNTRLMLTIIKSLNTVFPHVKVYHSPYRENDVLLVASRQPFSADKYPRFYNAAGISRDFRQMRKPFGYYSIRNYIASIDTLRPLSDPSPANSDYVPMIDAGAEKAFYLREKVDLFDPLSDSIVAYQEFFEPEKYALFQRENARYYSGYRPDARALNQLSRALDMAGPRSNWGQLEGMLYQLMPAPVLRDLWLRLDVVDQFREHVDAGEPPLKTQLLFRFLDNVSHRRFADNGPVIEGIMQRVPAQQVGPVIIRALLVNTAMLGDQELFARLYTRYVDGNPSISATELRFIQALRTRLQGAS